MTNARFAVDTRCKHLQDSTNVSYTVFIYMISRISGAPIHEYIYEKSRLSSGMTV